jgi:HAMP domain-containing protein
VNATGDAWTMTDYLLVAWLLALIAIVLFLWRSNKRP